MATSPSASKATSDPLLHLLMGTLIAGVRSDGPDLTARQMAVFLKVYLEPGVDHTVRGLAATLGVSKPAITRALDRLAEFDFTKREIDPHDRRSVIARRTPAGSTYLRTLASYMAEASKAAKK